MVNVDGTGAGSCRNDLTGASVLSAALPGVDPRWFAVRLSLIDLLRRSYFSAVPDPWASAGRIELPHGGFVRWEWLDEMGSPVHVEIDPGSIATPDATAAEVVDRLVRLGWNSPRHPSSLCWIEAPRPDMWLRTEQRQRFVEAADRIILALTVVLRLVPADVDPRRVTVPWADR